MATKSKFTQGELRIQNDTIICVMHDDGGKPHGLPIAHLYNNDWLGEEENQANKDLLKASADMYFALKALIDYFRANDENYYKSDLCTDAIAALNKADGVKDET